MVKQVNQNEHPLRGRGPAIAKFALAVGGAGFAIQLGDVVGGRFSILPDAFLALAFCLGGFAFIAAVVALTAKGGGLAWGGLVLAILLVASLFLAPNPR